MEVKLIAVVIATFLVSSCATYDPPPLSAEDMAAKCNQQKLINSWTEDCMAWDRQRNAELDAKNKADEAVRAANWKIQSEQQAKQMQEKAQQEAEAIGKDERDGYKYISFEDFALDGFKLKGARVSIRGLYVDQGGRLIRDQFSVARWVQTSEESKGVNIPLMTEDASRDARAAFLRCANANMPLGCGMVIRGRVKLLTLQNRLGVKWQEVGIAVETIRP